MKRTLGPISQEEASAINADFVAFMTQPTAALGRDKWYECFKRFSLDDRDFAKTIREGDILLVHEGGFVLVRVEEVVGGSISEVDVRVSDGITGSWRIDNCAKVED